MCQAVSTNNSIRDKIKVLFDSSSSSIPVYKIGIPTNWKNEPLWS